MEWPNYGTLCQIVNLDELFTIYKGFYYYSAVHDDTELIETEFDLFDRSLLLIILKAIVKEEDLSPCFLALRLHQECYMDKDLLWQISEVVNLFEHDGSEYLKVVIILRDQVSFKVIFELWIRHYKLLKLRRQYLGTVAILLRHNRCGSITSVKGGYFSENLTFLKIFYICFSPVCMLC